MLLFPDRPRRRRDVVTLALLLSLVLHLALGGTFSLWGRRPAPPEDMAATADVIRLERKPVPPPVHRTPPRAAPPARGVAQQPPPAVRVFRAQPAAIPAYAPRGTIHNPPARHAVPPRRIAQAAPEPEPVPAPANRLSDAQIAALESQMRATIAQAQASLTEVPAQRRPPSTMKRYKMIMAGTLDDVQSAQGICRPVDTKTDGPYVWHIEDCDFLYKDGYREHVTIPWWQRYSRSDDPVDHPNRRYVVQPPPDSAPAPNPINFSRLVCTFYRSECQALIERENAAGGRPAPGD